jgi:hypothetical protein
MRKPGECAGRTQIYTLGRKQHSGSMLHSRPSGQLPSGFLTELSSTLAGKIDGRSKNALAIPISCKNEKLRILAAAVALANGRRFPSLPFGRRVIKNARSILLGRPMLRYLFERAMRDGPQSAQGAVSPLRTKLQFLCDVAAAFVVAAVREDAAGLFQNEIHVCNRPIIQFGHGTTSPGACAKPASSTSAKTV